jgi:hypothetical protein
MWHAALLDGLAKPDSKSRSEALSSALDSLGRGAAAAGGEPPAYLHELCAALAPSLADNNAKIATQAAGVVELLCAGGSLPEGAFRGALDALAPPLTELLGNAKVRRGRGEARAHAAPTPPTTPHIYTHTPHSLSLSLSPAALCSHSRTRTHARSCSPRVARALPTRCWR